MSQMSLSRSPLAAAILLTMSLPVAAQTLDTTSTVVAAGTLSALQSDPIDTVEVQGTRLSRSSSPKRTEPILDTPQTIVVIPNQVFTGQAQTSLRDVLRNTAGITVQAGEGGGAPGDNVFVRGFGARNDIFIDGVRDPGVLSRDTFNVEQVEVAKGPASTISGRGSTGGAINLMSKMAKRKASGDVRLTVGTDSYQRAAADINQPINEHASLRVNAVWTDAGVAGRDAVENENQGIATSLAFGLGTPTRLYVNLSHMNQDNVPDYGLPGTLPAATPANIDIDDLDWSNFYGLTSRDHEDVSSTQGSVIVEHDFENGTQLRNLLRYGRNLRDTVVTAPRAANAFASNGTTPQSLNDPGFDPSLLQIRRTDVKYQDREDEIFANQTNVSFDVDTGTARHAIVAGLELSRERSISFGNADYCAPADGSVPPVDLCPGGRPPVTDLFNPNPGDHYRAQIYRTGASSSAEADSIALYAFDTVHLGDRWELSAGIRQERFDVDATVTAATAADGTPGTVQRFSRRDDMTSWRAGVVYKPTANSSLYTAYGTSFNPSADGRQGLSFGENSNGTIGSNSATLAPEETRSLEAGVKWNVSDNRLLLTAAVFRSEKTNAQSTDASGNTVLTGDQRVEGIELGVSGNLTDRWMLFGGYAYTDGKIRESANSAEVDRELQFVPRHAFNLWTTYEILPRLTVGGGAQYTGGYFFNNTNTTANANIAAIQDHTRYWLYNAMVAYDINPQWDVQFNVNNVADERYVERGYTGHFSPGSSRTFLLSLHYHY
jgi:catecholate siderophore receptor